MFVQARQNEKGFEVSRGVFAALVTMLALVFPKMADAMPFTVDYGVSVQTSEPRDVEKVGLNIVNKGADGTIVFTPTTAGRASASINITGPSFLEEYDPLSGTFGIVDVLGYAPNAMLQANFFIDDLIEANINNGTNEYYAAEGTSTLTGSFQYSIDVDNDGTFESTISATDLKPMPAQPYACDDRFVDRAERCTIPEDFYLSFWDSNAFPEVGTMIPSIAGWLFADPANINVTGSPFLTNADFSNGLQFDIRAISAANTNAIPEPTTMALFGLGLLGFGARKRSSDA